MKNICPCAFWHLLRMRASVSQMKYNQIRIALIPLNLRLYSPLGLLVCWLWYQLRGKQVFICNCTSKCFIGEWHWKESIKKSRKVICTSTTLGCTKKKKSGQKVQLAVMAPKYAAVNPNPAPPSPMTTYAFVIQIIRVSAIKPKK